MVETTRRRHRGLTGADYALQECQVELNPAVDADETPGDDPEGDGTSPPVSEGEDGSVTGGM